MRTVLPLLLLVAAAAGLLPAQPGRFGLPACAGPDRELATRSSFLICHSATRKAPLWTAHEIVPEPPGHEAAPRPRRLRFRRDTLLEHAGATDADYRNSGWSRGHLVPAADVSADSHAYRDSFLLSNAVPQHRALNSGKWRLLEQAIRGLTQTAQFVLVFTGPVFCPDAETIGPNHVAVPCQLFKVVLAGHADRLEAFAALLPNDRNPDEPLHAFAVPVAEVERRTGLDFFSALAGPAQAALESEARPLPASTDPESPVTRHENILPPPNLLPLHPLTRSRLRNRTSRRNNPPAKLKLFATRASARQLDCKEQLRWPPNYKSKPIATTQFSPPARPRRKAKPPRR